MHPPRSWIRRVPIEVVLQPPFMISSATTQARSNAVDHRYLCKRSQQCKLTRSKRSQDHHHYPAKTGDYETFTAVETGPDTGVFRIFQQIPTQDARLVAVIHGDGVIETIRNDTLTAEIEGCGSTRTETTLLIDPDGVIFDSRTDAPIAGVTVTLIDANTGSPAIVFKADGVTPAASTVVTDASGRYEFPTVAPGIYRLVITAPPGYSVPSQVHPSALPPGRLIDFSGSYGGTFPVSLKTGAVKIDVPADAAPGAGAGFFVQKVASRREAEIGDAIQYTVRIKNVGVTQPEVKLIDNLPPVSPIKGTARLDGGRADGTPGHASNSSWVQWP